LDPLPGVLDVADHVGAAVDPSASTWRASAIEARIASPGASWARVGAWSRTEYAVMLEDITLDHQYHRVC
jgi:hypothetical protein